MADRSRQVTFLFYVAEQRHTEQVLQHWSRCAIVCCLQLFVFGVQQKLGIVGHGRSLSRFCNKQQPQPRQQQEEVNIESAAAAAAAPVLLCCNTAALAV